MILRKGEPNDGTPERVFKKLSGDSQGRIQEISEKVYESTQAAYLCVTKSMAR
jgi:hypothetical protein